MRSILFIVTVISLFALRAYSAVHIEPFVGYQTGDLENVSGSTSYVDGDTNGQYLGARLGYGMLGFSAGVDYTIYMGNYERSTDNQEVDFDGNELGIYAKYELPVLLQVYASYIISADHEINFSTPAEIEGNGYKLGVGFTGLPFLAINLEYKTISFDEATQGTSTITNYANDFNAYSLNLSLPLDL